MNACAKRARPNVRTSKTIRGRVERSVRPLVDVKLVGEQPTTTAHTLATRNIDPSNDLVISRGRRKTHDFSRGRMSHPKRIETERLELEQLCHDNVDLLEFYRCLSDHEESIREVTKYTAGRRSVCRQAERHRPRMPSSRARSTRSDYRATERAEAVVERFVPHLPESEQGRLFRLHPLRLLCRIGGAESVCDR